MPKTPDLSDPFPSVLPYLVEISQQLAYSYNRTNTADSNFGTLTTARRGFKPFIIGFIAPENSINFRPFDVKTHGISITADPLPPPRQQSEASPEVRVNSGGDRPTLVKRASTGLASIVYPKTRTIVKAPEMRAAIATAYQKMYGQKPTDEQVATVFGHLNMETGDGFGRVFYGNNYNFGNIHSGKAGSFKPGPHGPWKGELKTDPVTKKKLPPQPGNTGPPPSIAQWTDKIPTTGTASYLGVDASGSEDGTVWYPTYFLAFAAPDEYVQHHYGLLERGYPNAARATTIEEYNRGLTIGTTRGKYYAANPEKYIKGIERGYNYYFKNFGDVDDGLVMKDQPGGYDATAGFVEDLGTPPEGIVPENDAGPAGPTVMRVGDYSGTEIDPAGDRIGRGVNLTSDTKRIDLVREQTEYLKQQIELVRQTPPLLLLINPATFDRSFQHATDNSSKSRFGTISHRWMERPMEISSNGVTAGQYAFDSNGNGGLTTKNRVHTISYQNLLSLLGIYKNNGMIFANGGRKGGHTGVNVLPFSVYIYYDNHLYIGSFDSFGTDDDASKPYNMTYDFKFTCRYHESVGSDIIDSRSVGAVPSNRVF